MSTLSGLLTYTCAFERALGTGLLIHTSREIPVATQQQITDWIQEFEVTLSRFREDSLVWAMQHAEQGGSFTFPTWVSPLFDLYDQLAAATAGALDPCVGEDLIRLGYDHTYRLTCDADSWHQLGTIHGRATWSADVSRDGTTLTTSKPVALDFGACGKGFFVDSVRALLADYDDIVIDAGGDLCIAASEPITIALESPFDTSQAIGIIAMSRGALCASAPSRRSWRDTAGRTVHHLLNAIDGQPACDVTATWVSIDESTPYPTAHADGIATALFTTPANQLRSLASFDCAILDAGGQIKKSQGFAGVFFTA